MKFIRYSRYSPNAADDIDLQKLMGQLSDFVRHLIVFNGLRQGCFVSKGSFSPPISTTCKCPT